MFDVIYSMERFPRIEGITADLDSMEAFKGLCGRPVCIVIEYSINCLAVCVFNNIKRIFRHTYTNCMSSLNEVCVFPVVEYN